VDLNQRFVQGIDVKQSEVNIHPQHQPQKPISMSPRPSAKAKEQQQHRIRKDRTPPLHIERESSLTMMTNFPISFDRTIAQFESEAAQRRSTYIQQQPNRESSLDFGSPRIKMEPNQPGIGMARYGASRYEVENNGYEPDDSDGSGGGRRKGEAVTAVEIDKKTKDHHRGEASLEHHRDEDDGMIKWASPTLAKTKFMQQFTTFSVQREGTQTTMNSGGTSGSRIKAKRRSFERPPNVTTLDSVSAISLDDFWQK
jgi:hypothetical protein